MFEDDFKPATEKERVERAFLAQAAKLIVDKAWYDVDWGIYFRMFMFDPDEILHHVPRLFRSQSFGDPDYPRNVYQALELAYQIDQQRAIAMIIYILDDIRINEEELTKYPAVKAFLENKDLTDFSQLLPKIGASFTKYLDISDVPDPFYRDLIELINKCYSYGIYPAVLIFSRKLLENLLVDILRKKYGMQNVELFFDTKRRRFRSFNELLKNFEEKLNDFIPIIPHLDTELIRKINTFREAGNSSAHTLEVNIQKSWLDEKQADLEYVVKTLIRLYNNIAP
ncbi:hypothetical protein [Archaeoglobus sp.]